MMIVAMINEGDIEDVSDQPGAWGPYVVNRTYELSEDARVSAFGEDRFEFDADGEMTLGKGTRLRAREVEQRQSFEYSENRVILEVLDGPRKGREVVHRYARTLPAFLLAEAPGATPEHELMIEKWDRRFGRRRSVLDAEDGVPH